MIPYGRQHVDEGDVEAVAEVLRSDWLTQGPTVERFERAVADHVGALHAVAFSSGTAALHGAAHVAGLGPGDVVATSPLTFIASANCARYVGATPYLVDIDPTTWNLDLSTVPDNATAAVPVHYAGLPVDLAGWARPTGVVIEDAAHALGATTPDGPVGNCAHSHLTCFSFHPVKPITTAEGGMVTTNDADLAERLRRFRSHGTERRPSEGGWAYAAVELGFNYRLSDVHAALGLHQLPKLEGFIRRRNEIAAHYRDCLSEIVGLPPAAPAGSRHGYHLFAVLVPERRRVYDELRAQGIAVQVHYVPVHHHPVGAIAARPAGGLPTCEDVYERVISLPIYPDLTDQQVDEVIRSVEAVVGAVGAMSEPAWIIRADAGECIGVGHVIRCLSLAEAAATRGRRAYLVSRDLPEPLAERARSSGVEVVSAASPPGTEADGAFTAVLATDAEAVVVDGYHFCSEFRTGLGELPAVIVSIEDNLENDAAGLDVIVNPAPHARPEEYAGRGAIVLLGLSYALLRREVLELDETRRSVGPASTAVVVMGGTDVVGAAGPISEAIVEQTPLDVLVMTGIGTERSFALEDLAARSGGRISALPFDRLPQALLRADVGVVAAGGTLWEAAALGLPTVAAITADNQERLTATPEVRSFATVHDLRTSVALDEIVDDVLALAADPERRRRAGAAGRFLVDGRGTTRVVDAVLACAGSRGDRWSSRTRR